GETILLDLKSADRPVEHHPILRVGQCFLETGHRRADCAPRDTITRLRETHQRAFQTAGLRKERVRLQVDILKHKLTRVARAEREFTLLVFGREARDAAFDDESSD